jgi:hypothetical protein
VTEPGTAPGTAEDLQANAAPARADGADAGVGPSASDADPASEAVRTASDAEISDESTESGGAGPSGLPAPGPSRSSQRAGGARSSTSAASIQAAHDRRDNPLLTGLVKAMRDSAKITREETTARLRVEAEARVTAIRGRSAADAVALRTQADEDMAAIREWSKAEMARIRLETTERIDARRGQLATDSHALSSLTGRLVAEIEAAVTSFEAEMKGFFKALLAEEDPAQLATLAERMPAPPVLESLPEAVAVGIDHVSSGARSRAGRTATKPAKGAKRAARPSAPKPATGAAQSSRANRRATTTVAGDQGTGPAAVGLAVDATALDPEAAALAEAEALAGLDLSAVTGGEWPVVGASSSSNGTAPHGATDAWPAAEPAPDGVALESGAQGAVPDPSVEPAPEPASDGAEESFMIESQPRLIVVGLGDAGVAAFEGALRGVSGVGSVNVSPGGDGEVVFSVTHGTATDLRAAVPGFNGFRAQVTADEGAILSVSAHDPH